MMNDIDKDADESHTAKTLERVLSRAGTVLDSETNFHDADVDQLERLEREATRRIGGWSTELADVTEVENRQLRLERVVLLGLAEPGENSLAEIGLRELAALAETAGSQVLEAVLQTRKQPDPATFIGKGKAEELRGIVAATAADTVIVDGELAPSQRRALEDIVKVKVVDRTAVILDIFAQHAKSKEGKAQVELAQLEYLLPRLRGWGESMSRQAGGRVAGGEGIGSRGPGETKIELDRRRIRTRMSQLRRQIKNMAPARQVQRTRRLGLPNVVIVGYTNAGKSSLLNRLTGAKVLVDNALFATLDPTVRHAVTPDGRDYTLSDTVGFVRNLPHQLVAAFASTLEEVGHADLILHVVDAANSDPIAQIQAVREVLSEVPGADQVPEVLVLNKIDQAPVESLLQLHARPEPTVEVSALTGQGLSELQDEIATRLPRPVAELQLTIPYHRGDLVHQAYRFGEILQLEHRNNGTWVHVRVDAKLAAEMEEIAVAESILASEAGQSSV